MEITNVEFLQILKLAITDYETEYKETSYTGAERGDYEELFDSFDKWIASKDVNGYYQEMIKNIRNNG